MTRFRALTAALCAAALVCLAAVAAARADEKEKPKDAPTLDDATAMLVETAGGKEKKTKIDLKYSLKVKGYFDKDGFNIEEVDNNGPAFHLDDGNGNTGLMLEKGDIIVEVDGKPVKSAKDYAKAMNGAADHSKTKIKVKDVRTGNELDLTADAEKL
jgi:S1-C subfamily serine protease